MDEQCIAISIVFAVLLLCFSLRIMDPEWFFFTFFYYYTYNTTFNQESYVMNLFPLYGSLNDFSFSIFITHFKNDFESHCTVKWYEAMAK